MPTSAARVGRVLDGSCVPMERAVALNKWAVVGETLGTCAPSKGHIDKTDDCVQAAALDEKIWEPIGGRRSMRAPVFSSAKDCAEGHLLAAGP